MSFSTGEASTDERGLLSYDSDPTPSNASSLGMLTCRISALGLAVGVATLVLVAVLFGLALGPGIKTRVKAETLKNCSQIDGLYDATTGCYHSDQSYIDARAATVRYFSSLTPSLYLWFSFDWSTFYSDVPIYRYGKTPAAKLANPQLQAGLELLDQLDAVLANPSITDLEKAKAQNSREEVQLWVSLDELNFGHSRYGYNWGWDVTPFDSDDFLSWILPTFFSGEPDYDQKAIEYMRNLEAEWPHYLQFYQDILTQDFPPHVEPEQTRVGYEDLANDVATPQWRYPICDAMTAGPLQTECYALSDSIDTVTPVFAAFYNGPYADACALHRPAGGANKPGIGQVHNGNETYAAWLKYFTGIDITPEETYARGLAGVAEIRANIEALHGSVFPGEDFDDFVARKADLNDPTYYACFDDVRDVEAHVHDTMMNISRGISDEIQYYPRTVLSTQWTGGVGGASYRPPNYDPHRNLFDRSGQYRYGLAGYDDQERPCFYRHSNALAMHEGYTGHGLETPLNSQVKCVFENVWTFRSVFSEGWSHYSEQFCIWTELCDDPLEEASGYWSDRMVRALRLVVDPGMAVFGMTPDECAALLVANGVPPAQSLACYARYTELVAQSTTYRIGSDVFTELREHAESVLGPDFDAPELNMLFTKFGTVPLTAIIEMVDTYLVWKQNRAAAVGLKWFTMIDQQLYKSADPIAGVGFVPLSDSGVIQPAHPAAASIDAVVPDRIRKTIERIERIHISK